MPRSQKVYKKKTFSGNRYTSNISKSSTVCSSKDTGTSSRSKEKLGNPNDKDKEFNINNFSDCQNNLIINMSVLHNFFAQTACPLCHNKSLKISEDVQLRKGLCSVLALSCTDINCNFKFNNPTSLCSTNCYDINLRTVYALRSIGRGRESAQKFFSILDLPAPPVHFFKINNKLLPILKNIATESMKSAVQETIEKCESNEFAISVDGSWQKRGHTSLNGVVTAISVETGKVVDIECLSKYCQKCNVNKCANHNCLSNYSGTSGGMEAMGAKRIYQRSEELYNAKYVQYLGDGDSKAFAEVVKSQPYGQNITITKVECISHVQKRMGSRLRRLKSTMKGKLLDDGKSLAGKGRLTDSQIDKLQSYYGQAIRGNTNNLQNMREAVWATFYHRRNNHGMCPKGDSSWCSENNPNLTFNPASCFPDTITDAIKPIFRDLANPDLLRKCLHGKTQNANESLNEVLWIRCPKNIFVGPQVLQIGAHDAVLSYNDGEMSKLKVLSSLGIQPGKNMATGLQHIDALRISKAEIKCGKAVKRKHIEEKENDDYAAGQF